MARNWGRLIAADLDESEKLAACSERAALVWAAFTTPKHDGEGRLEVDDVELLRKCGRFAIVHRWTLEDMAAVRSELENNGLWRIYRTPSGKLCAEVTNWRNKQRLDRIKRGSDIDLEAIETEGGNSGGTRGENGGNSGGLEGAARASQDKRSEEKGSQEPARARMSKEDASGEWMGGRNPESDFDKADVERIATAFEEKYRARYAEDLAADKLDRSVVLQNLSRLRSLPSSDDWIGRGFDYAEEHGGPKTLRALTNLHRDGKLTPASFKDPYDGPKYIREDQLPRSGAPANE